MAGLWVEAIDKLANASLIAYHLLKEAIYCHGSAKGQDFSQTHGTPYYSEREWESERESRLGMYCGVGRHRLQLGSRKSIFVDF